MIAIVPILAASTEAGAAAGAAAGGHGHLLGSIALCIGAAAVLAFIANKLRQPALLAYLAAGVLIGPEIGLELITDPHTIEVIAEVGLILLLFMIGLEIDVKKLLASGRAVIVPGILQFPICLVLGMGFYWMIGFELGDPHAFGGKFGVAYLALATGLSSTMIVVKLLYDKFELDTLPGRISLGILVFQDLWIIVALALQQNLDNPQFGPMMGSFIKGGLLVVFSFGASKFVLPHLFKSIAKMPELVLVTSLAWVFVVCAGAAMAGLSPEMGALIAGVAMSTFPYSIDVVAKVTSIRDFFVTLYFVGLGMKIPMPTPSILMYAGLGSLFLMVSRFLSIFPILYSMKLGHRASLLPSVNLTQMCDFTLVFASLGMAANHIDRNVVSILVLIYSITSVTSTYMINFSDRLWRPLSRTLNSVGLHDIEDVPDRGEPEHKHDKQIVLLGFFRQASSILNELEVRHSKEGDQSILHEILVIDFNPLVHAELKKRGVSCVYGDIAHMDTLHHAGVHGAKLAVSTIPDAILKATNNARLMNQVRNLSPETKVILTSDSIPRALEFYELGADFVLLPRLQSSKDMADIIEECLRGDVDELRRTHIAELKGRNEVLA